MRRDCAANREEWVWCEECMVRLMGVAIVGGLM